MQAILAYFFKGFKLRVRLACFFWIWDTLCKVNHDKSHHDNYIFVTMVHVQFMGWA